MTNFIDDSDEPTPTPVTEPFDGEKVARYEEAPADAEAPTTRQASAWAEAKGMLPRFGSSGPSGGQVQSSGYWKFAAAQAHKGWTDTDLISEADFDAAVAEATSQISR